MNWYNLSEVWVSIKSPKQGHSTSFTWLHDPKWLPLARKINFLLNDQQKGDAVGEKGSTTREWKEISLRLLVWAIHQNHLKVRCQQSRFVENPDRKPKACCIYSRPCTTELQLVLPPSPAKPLEAVSGAILFWIRHPPLDSRVVPSCLHPRHTRFSYAKPFATPSSGLEPSSTSNSLTASSGLATGIEALVSPKIALGEKVAAWRCLLRLWCSS